MSIEVGNLTGWKQHPFIHSIGIGEDGTVVYLETMSIIPQQLNGFLEYLCINVPSYGTQFVHILVAETYVPLDKTIFKPILNHKDGDKFNNHKDNLEWSTYSGNLTHAYLSGLRSDNMQVEVKNLLSGEIIRFNSLQETARHFNVNGEKVHRSLHTSKLYPFEKEWNIRLVGGKWKPLDDTHVNQLVSRKMPEDVVLFKPETKEAFIFSSVLQAAEYLNTAYGNLRYRLTGPGTTPVNGFYVYYKRNFDKIESTLVDKRCEKMTKSIPTRTAKRIKVVNNTTSEISEWESVIAFSKTVAANPRTIQKSMWLNDGVWKNYFIEYLS